MYVVLQFVSLAFAEHLIHLVLVNWAAIGYGSFVIVPKTILLLHYVT